MQAPHERLVVFDIDFPQFLGNRAFDRAAMNQYPGAGAICALAERLAESDVSMITPDLYLSQDASAHKTVVLSNETTRYTHDLLFERGLKGAVCTSGESPIVAWRFYENLPETSSWYDHVVLFPGVRGLAPGTATFHDFTWPYPDFALHPGKPWDRRALLTMVSGNKRAFGWPRPAFDFSHPKPSAGRWYRAWQARSAHRRNPWMGSELYLERLAAIRHFGGTDGFDLLGRGWDQPTSGADTTTQSAINSSYRGEVPPHDKVKTLGGYRFSLCFENTQYPGYITEKIFDCLVSGCIPVYLGAPDVDAYIPRSAFIDLRDFGDYAALEAHLRQMSTEQSERHVVAAREFLASGAAAPFTETHYVDMMSGLLLESFEGTR
ncbi:MAG: glycosyltransferase family 10 [Actinomycetota bacterium]|nr:glycosyltransferase family 10 [Actinomycetota bacterium]